MLYAMFGPTRPRKKVTFHSPVATEVSPEPEYRLSSDENSDNISTCAVIGTDNEIKNTASTRSKIKSKGRENMTTTDESSDGPPEWTREEDRIICVRKSEAKSWAEIGKELKRGRRECQQRHRALSSHAKELGITTAKLAKLYIDEDEDYSRQKKNSKDRNEGNSKNNNKKTDKSKAEHKSKSKDAANSDSKPKTTSKMKKNKNKKRASETSSDSASDSDSDSSSEDDDPEGEYWAQRRYIYDTLYGGMYPDQKVLRPDRFYSESDCRVLAGLEARYRANKWLYIQADFCNATGRMVEAEILRAKFYENQNCGGALE